MKRFLGAIFSAILGLGGLVAYSQAPTQVLMDSLMNDHKIIFYGQGDDPQADSIRTLVEHFYYDQFRNFQDPAAPYFLFMSRDANLAMGIGGMVRMRGYFDWGGSVNQPAFSPYFIPVTKDPLTKNRLGTTPAGTAVVIYISRKPTRQLMTGPSVMRHQRSVTEPPCLRLSTPTARQ